MFEQYNREKVSDSSGAVGEALFEQQCLSCPRNMGPHGGVGIEIDTQVPYKDGRDNEIPNSRWNLGNLVLSPTC